LTPPLLHQELSYRVNAGRGEKKQLLADVTGFFEPGRLAVLMVGVFSVGS
jgi:hypothetical protein